MKLFLKVWKQEGPEDEGHFESHVLDGVSEDSSFLEMLDHGFQAQLAALHFRDQLLQPLK